MKRTILLSLIGAILFLGLSNCNKNTIGANNEGVSLLTSKQLERAEINYKNYCSGCHGEQMQAFVDRKWAHGDTEADIIKGIKYGYPDGGMPAYDTTFTDDEVQELAKYILEGIKGMDRYAFQDAVLTTDTFSSASLKFELDTVASGMKSPWGMTFLSNGDMLVTEKSGTLYRVTSSGAQEKVEGLPTVVDKGQGGLLDVELHPKFNENQVIYLSYSKQHPQDADLATTAIFRAKLVGNRLTEGKDIFVAEPYAKTRHHYGSRLEFDKNGYLFFSVGDRGNQNENPQNLNSDCGKIHRINDDGSIPSDNPFVNTAGARPSIFSYGHRNPQGVAMNPATGKIWTHEHGPRGGDEINISESGKNYGWPVISYGINYNGTTFTNLTAKEGMEQPLTYWVPSIAPCGMTFVKGNRYPSWSGSLLVGSLRFKYLNLCKIENNKVVSQELLMKNIGRVRNVEIGKDGYIYVAVEDPGFVYRLMPIQG